MKKIKLTQGKFALVDDEDFEQLSKLKWGFDNSNGYARRVICGNEKIYMHRMIMKTPKRLQTDHINHNKLDNRKINLRIVVQSQNNMNRKKVNNKYGYKGINFYNHRKYYTQTTGRVTHPKTWRANIKINKKRISLGFFFTKEEAAQAYNEAAQKYFGEYAYLNKI